MSDNGLFIAGERQRARAELEDRALRAASGLKALGVQPGEAVALMLRNDFAFFEGHFAATSMGAYTCTINWHLAAPEVAYVIEDSGTRVLIAHADLLNAVPEAVAAAEKSGVIILTVPTPDECRVAYGLDGEQCAVPDGHPVWDDWLSAFEPLAELYDEVTETMYYTSGTTGLPKGVRRYPQIREKAEAYGKMRDWIYGIEPGIRGLVAGPLYHSAPNAFSMRAAKQAERMVVMPRFSSEGFLKHVHEHKITNAFMVPTMFVRILKLPEEVRAKYDMSSLKHIMIAAAPCPPDIKRAIIEWWGPVIHEFYGSTELGYMTVCNSEETLERPGTVGRAVDGTTLKALDEDGNEVPVGTPGELYGRMELFADFTYHNRPDERVKVERDGLVTCGDVGYFDEDGYLFLCDRTREMVISGGVNIYPAEIEHELVGMPGVMDCAVFGIPDVEYGERLMAVIQPQAGTTETLTAEAVATYLEGRLAGYKIPREIELRPDLPRDDAGKIYKRRLRDPYWESQTRRI